MTRNSHFGWLCCALLIVSTPAVAQAQMGGSEDPVTPKTGVEKSDAGKNALYPIELIFRPLTLPSAMSQVALDYPVNLSPFAATGVLAASYGITSEIQIGLRYGLGSLTEDGFTEGKAVAIDAMYSLHRLVAAQLSIPVLLDPVSTGIVFGAPFRVQFGKMALVGGRDLVSIKVKRFVPSVSDPLADAALVAADSTGTILPRGAIRLVGGVEYQHNTRVAFAGEIGIIANDFSLSDPGVPLIASAMYSFSRKLDLGGRLGFGSLGDAGNTFGIAAFVALRI